MDFGTPGGCICLGVTGDSFVITRSRRRGRGKGGRVVLKVRDSSHLSHGEIVLVTNDDDILAYKA